MFTKINAFFCHFIQTKEQIGVLNFQSWLTKSRSFFCAILIAACENTEQVLIKIEQDFDKKYTIEEDKK